MRPCLNLAMARLSALLVTVISATAVGQSSSSNAAADRAGLSAAQMRADIVAFRNEFLARDSSYSPAAREQATKRLQQLEQSVEHASQAAFELELARLVALADNGHTVAFAGPRSRHFNRVPIRLTPFSDEWRVLQTTNEQANLLGAKLVAIDGHALAELRTAARTLAGGTPAWRDRNAAYLFESPEQLHALGLATRSSDATYSFVTLDGHTVDRRLTGEAPSLNTARGNSDRWLYPELLATEAGRWRALLDTSKTPWSLADVNAPFRSRSAPEIDAVVVQLRQTTDSPDHSIRDFLHEMTQKIQSEHPRNLVVDMRLNGGGDLNTARDFMKSLPTLVPGRIFVLTSPWTFSAAISSVGYLKQSAPERVTIVGEEVGDRLVFFAEGRPVTLPQSQTIVLYATERHDYQNGCKAFTDCHAPVVRNPIAVPSLAPEIAAPWTIDAYRAGRDPGMEAVARALGRGAGGLGDWGTGGLGD